MSLHRPTVGAALLAVLLAAVVAAPAAAQYSHRDHTLRFRAGLFEPDGESAYWNDTAELFSGAPEDFEDTILGIDYRLGLGEHLALMISASGYEGQDTRNYLDFVDTLDREIRHEATLDVASFTAGLMLRFAPRAAVSPYVGAGGGIYAWELTERGRFIDFGTPDREIFRA
ncbi:MAG: hypothetical protein PVG07_03705, partial [Acidobacteriota bacterium]